MTMGGGFSRRRWLWIWKWTVRWSIHDQHYIYFSAEITTSKSRPISSPFSQASESPLDTSKRAEESSTETNEEPAEELEKGDSQRRETQHTNPDWLDFLIKNFKTEIVMDCSSRTVRAVVQNEVIKVCFKMEFWWLNFKYLEPPGVQKSSKGNNQCSLG